MSIAEEVGVKITGDATGAVAAFNLSEEAASRALTKMLEHFASVGAVSKESMAATGRAAKHAAHEVEESETIIGRATGRMKEHFDGVKEHYEHVSGVFAKINTVMLGAMALLAGGEGFEKAIEKTNELAAENLKLSKTFGINLAQASGMHAALAKFGLDTETVTGAVQKMDRQVRTHESTLNDMGVKTRDASGALLNQLDIFMNGIDALRQYKEGTDRNIAAQTMFGRGAGDTAALLKLNRQELEEGAESARKLGLVTDQEGVASMKRYKIAINETKEVFEAIMVAIGKRVLPILTELAEYIKNNGETVMERLAIVLDVLGQVFIGVGQIIGVFGHIVTDVFALVGDIIQAVVGGGVSNLNLLKISVAVMAGAFQAGIFIIRTALADLGFAIVVAVNAVHLFASVLEDLLTLNFSKLVTDVSAGFKRIGDAAVTNANRVKAAWNDAHAAVAGGSAPAEHAAGAPFAPGTKSASDLLKQPKEAKAKAAKAPKAAKVDEPVDEYMAWIKIRDAARAKSAKVAIELANIEAKGERDADLAKIDADAETAKRAFDMGKISKQQLLQLELKFAADRLAIKLKSIADEVAAEKAGPDDPVKLATLNQQRLVALRAFEAAKTKIVADAEAQRTQRTRTAITGIASSWSSALAKMATLQAGFGATIQSLWQGIAGTISGALTQVIQDYITKWLSSLLVKKAAQAADGATTVASESGKAGAGGIASMAAAPFPLNLGAPAFGASMAAAALAFAPAASAMGGWDVPASVGRGIDGRGGMGAIIHPREMVLPADLADKVRNGGGGGGDIYHIHATDADSFVKMLHSNRGQVAKAVQGAVRAGVR